MVMNSQFSRLGNFFRTDMNSSNAAVEDYDRVSLRELLGALWRWKWVILICTLLAMLAAGLIARQITPSYTAQTKVMLNARESRVSTEMAVVSDLELTNPVVESEVASIMSNVLLGDVVRRIGADRLAPILPTPSPLSGARAWVFANIPSLSSLSKTEAEPNVVLRDTEQSLIEALKRNLVVLRDGNSYVILILMTSTNPIISAEIANTVAAVYTEHQLEERRAMARRATLWLDERVQELRGQVEAAENAVEHFRANQLVLDGISLDTVSQQLVTFTNQLAIAKADLASAQARYAQIQEVIKTDGVAATSRILTSPLVQSLRERRASAAREEAALATRYETNNAARQQLKAEMARTDSDLAQEISNIVEIQRNDVQIARLRSESMQQSLEQLEQQIIKFSQTSIKQRQLEREAAAIRTSYEELLSRLNETRTQETLQQADSKTIEIATPPRRPSAPRTNLMIATGGVVGAALGLGLVFLIEFSRIGFLSAVELERGTGLPVVTALPKGPWRDPHQAWRKLAANSHSAYGERIRHLRTLLTLGRKGSQVILLTSSVEDEGKTTTAIALAHMNALAKKSVLLVDCDIRRPSLREIFGLEAKFGLGDVIRGACALDQAIVTNPKIGFSVLPMLTPEPHLADQLEREWIQTFFADLRSGYDVIILDAPPILLIPDTFAFAKEVDTCLYLVRWLRTPPAAVRQGLAFLTEAHGPEPKLVLSMVNQDKMPNAYYDAS